MKRFLKLLVISVLSVITVFSLVACADQGGKGATVGLQYKKMGDDAYFTVYDYGKEVGTDGKTITVLDLSKYNKDGVSIGRIKAGAFDGNDSIKEIIVPDTVETIDAGAFKGMKSLEKITLPFVGLNANSDSYLNESADGTDKAVNSERIFCHIFGTESYEGGTSVTANYGGSTATYYLPARLSEVTVAPKAEYGIPMYAFSGVKQLYTVTLGDKVDAIGQNAFENCESLDKLSLPATLKNIYDGAFVGATNLKELSFAGIVLDKIGENAFKKTNIESFEISVKTIGDYAFSSSAVTKVILNGVEYIGNYAFADCEKLEASKVTLNKATTFASGINAFDFVI